MMPMHGSNVMNMPEFKGLCDLLNIDPKGLISLTLLLEDYTKPNPEYPSCKMGLVRVTQKYVPQGSITLPQEYPPEVRQAFSFYGEERFKNFCLATGIHWYKRTGELRIYIPKDDMMEVVQEYQAGSEDDPKYRPGRIPTTNQHNTEWETFTPTPKPDAVVNASS